MTKDMGDGFAGKKRLAGTVPVMVVISLIDREISAAVGVKVNTGRVAPVKTAVTVGV